MKIGFISDLHIDRSKNYQPKDYLQALANIIERQEISKLFVGGDISNHYGITIDFVEQLQNAISGEVYFIPGNHDFWEPKNEKKHTLDIYDIFKQHPQSVQNKAIMLNDDIALVGHTGWYNHAYHAPGFTQTQLDRGQHKLVTWQDKHRLDWQASDQEVSTFFAKEAQATFDDINLTQKPKQFLLMTHVITTPEFTILMPHRIFDFFNAYIATDDFLPFYQEYPISHSIMGHVHIRHKIEKDQTSYICNCLAYEREWRNNDLNHELEHALYTLDI